MKGILTSLVGAAAAFVLLSGCQTSPESPGVGDTTFLGYEGAQQQWPTADDGTLVQREYALPVYRDLPSKPYEIVGRIVGTQTHVIGRAFAQGLWSDRDRMVNVIEQARRQGADAVLMTRDPRIMEALKVPVGEAGAQERPLYDFDGVVVAIRFLQD